MLWESLQVIKQAGQKNLSIFSEKLCQHLS